MSAETFKGAQRDHARVGFVRVGDPIEIETTLTNTLTTGSEVHLVYSMGPTLREQLLAEAKAWREIAKRLACTRQLDFITTHLRWAAEGRLWLNMPPIITAAVREAMLGRIVRHCQMPKAGLPSYGGFRATRVLAALFLALECEDEARALTPKRAATKKRSSKSQPSRSSSQKKSGGDR